MHRYNLCFIIDGYLVSRETVEADSFAKAKTRLRRIYRKRKVTSIRLD